MSTLLACFVWSIGVNVAQSRPAPDPPAGRAIWQIGQFDNDTREFALGPGDYRRYAADAIFVVGQSDPRRDWPYVHPGPTDEWARGRAHDFAVFFGLVDATADAAFTLTIDFVDTQAVFPPRISCLINGTNVGSWHAPHGVTDASIEGDPSKGREAHCRFQIPPGRLRNGNNELIIRIDQGAWVLYDALRLDCTAGVARSAPNRPALRAQALPQEPVLYRGKDGLEQPLRVQVLNLGPPTEADILLDGKQHGRQMLAAGAQEIAIRIPAVQSRETRQLDVVAGETCRDGVFVDAEPVRKWEIYLLPHSHVDIGYTNIQTIVEEVHKQNIRESIKLARDTQQYPPEARFRWNVETVWATDAFLNNAPPAEKSELIDAIRKGWINLDASYVHALSGMTRPEELLRNFRLSRGMADQTGVPIDSMMLVDVPGAAWGIVPAMAHAGVKYFLMAPNALDRIGRARVAWEDRPFYWVSPSGREKVLVWQVVHYAVGHFLKGHYYSEQITKSDIAPPLKTGKPTEHFIDGYLWDRLRVLESEKFPYDMLVITWGLRDNAPIDADLPEAVKTWNEKYAYPRVIISSTHDAFVEFEKRYAARIPEVRGDYSPYWEEGAASTARESAMNRASSERLVQAETLFAMLKPSAYATPEFLDAWRFVLLFSEHTWGAHSSVWEPDSDFAVKQWDIKRSFAEQADARSRRLIAAALENRGDPVPDAVDVFNTSSWIRTDLVRVPGDLSLAGDRVEEQTGAPVPSQRLTTGELAFLARDIPALGGKRYLIRKGSAHVDARVSVSGAELKSEDYEIRVDPQRGTIASIKGRRIGRELVDAAADRAMNEYVYLLGSDVSQAKTSGPASLSIAESGPLVGVLRMTSAAPGVKSLTRDVQLVAGLDRVDLVNVVDKTAVREKEGVHFAFPSAVVGGQMRLDTPWAVVRPEIDQLPGANRNFLSVQRWIDISNDRYGVTWSPVDAALIEIGGLTGNLIGSQTNPDAWVKRLKPSQMFYSWVMNNHWHTNYKADQSGPVAFRYSVRAHDGYRPEAAARFGLERSQPLTVARAVAEAPAKPLVTIDSAGVLVSTLKPSDDGQALIIRLFGASGRDERVRLAWREPAPRSLTYTDLTERPGRAAGDAIDVPAWGIVSVRLEGPGVKSR